MRDLMKLMNSHGRSEASIMAATVSLRDLEVCPSLRRNGPPPLDRHTAGRTDEPAGRPVVSAP